METITRKARRLTIAQPAPGKPGANPPLQV